MAAEQEQIERDLGDPRQVSDDAKRAKLLAQRRLNALKMIMASPDGRVWMWEFLGRCGLFRVSFTGNGNRDAFDNGMKNAGMPVFVEIQKHCMDDYLKMMKENAA